MISYPVKMWWAVAITGVICIALAAAARKRRWDWVTLLSGLLVAGLFMVTTEMLWWMSG
jgi:hypothetical protein